MRKRRMGSVRNLCQAPDSVIMPLIILPHDGANRISDITIPKLCAQSGRAV